MAKNLMTNSLQGPPTPWQLRTADPGFGYAGGVRNIQVAYTGLQHRTSETRYKTHDLLKEQITYLKELKAELERQEDEFFELFGIKGKDKKESFKKLKDKIDAWNNTGAKALINDSAKDNEFYLVFQEMQRFAVMAEFPTDTWDNILNSVFRTVEGEEWIEDMIANDANIATLLNAIVEKKVFATGGRSSLIDNIKVSMDSKGKITVTSEREKITPSMQMKIKKALDDYIEKNESKFKPNYDFRAMFEAAYKRVSISEEGKRCITLALRDYKDVYSLYAFASNDKAIKGFLGEVYNNAFLYFMAGENEQNKEVLRRITPTGKVLNEKSKEIIIDTWLDGIGIQVKNYETNKIENKGFRVHDSYDAYHFITDVLQLDTTEDFTIGNILLNFFSAFDYNRRYPNLTKEQLSSDSYKYFTETRHRMRKELENRDRLAKVFTPYAAKILGINKAFSSENEDGLFADRDEYLNTFFNISGRYIPSSVIVQAIIDSIQKKGNKNAMDDLIKASFSTKTSISEEEKWHPLVSNQTVEHVKANRENYAAATTIRYSITLDVKSIVARIYSELK